MADSKNNTWINNSGYQNLKELLNDLIVKWRKPRGSNIHRTKINTNRQIYFWWDTDIDTLEHSLNDLCSLESWLWQFICWLDKDYLPFCSKCYIQLKSNNDKVKSDIWYEEEVNFWLMLSSIQEDKTQFLLDNIVSFSNK